MLTRVFVTQLCDCSGVVYGKKGLMSSTSQCQNWNPQLIRLCHIIPKYQLKPNVLNQETCSISLDVPHQLFRPQAQTQDRHLKRFTDLKKTDWKTHSIKYRTYTASASEIALFSLQSALILTKALWVLVKSGNYIGNMMPFQMHPAFICGVDKWPCPVRGRQKNVLG